MSLAVVVKSSDSTKKYGFMYISLSDNSLDCMQDDSECVILIINKNHQYKSHISVANLQKERSKLNSLLDKEDKVLLSLDNDNNKEVMEYFKGTQALSLCAP